MNFMLQGYKMRMKEHASGGYSWEVMNYKQVLDSGIAKTAELAKKAMDAAFLKAIHGAAERQGQNAKWVSKLAYWKKRRGFLVQAAVRQLDRLPKAEIIRDAEELEKDEWRALTKRFRKLFPEPGTKTHHLAKPASEIMEAVLECFEKLGYVEVEKGNPRYTLTKKLNWFVKANYGGWDMLHAIVNEREEVSDA